MRLNSGDIAPKDGSYKIIDPNGEIMQSVYVKEGDTLPPTQISGCYYEID